jgi:hypothetical protein
MSNAMLAVAIGSISMVLAMVGCTANLPYRTNFAPQGGDRNKAVIEVNAAYKLGFVEFDDQGWLWCDRQRTVVEQMIRDEAGITPGSSAEARGIILVAFVHGWKDNAAHGGEGVKACCQILQQLSNAEKAQTDHLPREVVGIYVGWRGLSARWEPFKELSFWQRKDTAHKVGGYGAMTRLLVDLEDIQKKSLDCLPEKAPRTELIIIGHSFGGAAVYSALSQIITERFAISIDKSKRLKPLGDQVILLNPAFEALRHYDLNQMALAIQRYPEDQRPVLSIFTSKGDWATHYFFPIGRFFSTLFENNRDRDQKTAGLETVGWFKPFVTHKLIYTAKSSIATTQTSTLNIATNTHEYHTFDKLLESSNHVKEERGKWHPNGPRAQTYTFDDTILQPNAGFHPGDPFLVVSVDQEVMYDHNDITNPVLINFLREYIQFCQVDSKDHSK